MKCGGHVQCQSKDGRSTFHPPSESSCLVTRKLQVLRNRQTDRHACTLHNLLRVPACPCCCPFWLPAFHIAAPFDCLPVHTAAPSDWLLVRFGAPSDYPSCRTSQCRLEWGHLECGALSVYQWYWPSLPVQDGLKYRTVKRNTVDLFLTTGTRTEMLGHGNFFIRGIWNFNRCDSGFVHRWGSFREVCGIQFCGRAREVLKQAVYKSMWRCLQEEYMPHYWFLWKSAIVFLDATFICTFLIAAVFYWSVVMKEERLRWKIYIQHKYTQLFSDKLQHISYFQSHLL